MRVVACGSRYATQKESIFYSLDEIHRQYPITEIIVGDARGADTLIANWAIDRKIPYRIFTANWKEYGKAAGPKRNHEMLLESPNLVVGFLISTDPCIGTRNTLSQSKELKIPTLEIML